MRLALVGVLAACTPIPPPPMMPSSVSTAPETRGTTTVFVVLGFAGEVLGGGGVGLALRAEHQETDHTTLGIELGGGRGDMGRTVDGELRHYLVAVRGYGRFSPGDHDWLALTYGAGLSVMRTGLVTGTLHGGTGVGAPNRYAVPIATTGLVLAVPLAHGEPFGTSFHGPNFGEPMPEGHPEPIAQFAVPHTRVFWYLDGGVVGEVGRATPSIDLGTMVPLNGPNGGGLIAGSLATGVRVSR